MWQTLKHLREKDSEPSQHVDYVLEEKNHAMTPNRFWCHIRMQRILWTKRKSEV